MENEFYAKDATAWRRWLGKNHAKRKNVWLIIYHQKSKTASVKYAEAVEEALCFGWIDSKPNKRDKESFFLFFTPRKPKSVWSKVNKERIAKLIKENRMTPVGLAAIERAKRDGSWATLDAVEALQMPAELAKAFSRRKKGLTNFEAFPPSVKKGLYLWVESAKTKETKGKRIKEIVTLAAQNVRANQWKKKE